MPLTLRGASSETGAEVCGAEGLCGCEDVKGVEYAGGGIEGIADDRGAVCAGIEATGPGGGNSEPPHMPQKRFSSEFSLPQRGQRTGPPRFSYSLRYPGGSMQAEPDGSIRKMTSTNLEQGQEKSFGNK